MGGGGGLWEGAAAALPSGSAGDVARRLAPRPRSLFAVAVASKFKPSLKRLLEAVILGSFVLRQVRLGCHRQQR